MTILGHMANAKRLPIAARLSGSDVGQRARDGIWEASSIPSDERCAEAREKIALEPPYRTGPRDLRDDFAAAAMGIAIGLDATPEAIARRAYEIADAMMARRAR